MTSFLGLEVEQKGEGISIYLDKYIEELISEYQVMHAKFIKPKAVPMSPGLLLDNSECPELPDPVKQKQYQSMIAKVQFAAYWIRFDISYTTSQLARFCASAGPSHWAALTHLIGYLIHRPVGHGSSWKLKRCTGNCPTLVTSDAEQLREGGGGGGLRGAGPQLLGVRDQPLEAACYLLLLRSAVARPTPCVGRV